MWSWIRKRPKWAIMSDNTLVIGGLRISAKDAERIAKGFTEHTGDPSFYAEQE